MEKLLSECQLSDVKKKDRQTDRHPADPLSIGESQSTIGHDQQRQSLTRRPSRQTMSRNGTLENLRLRLSSSRQSSRDALVQAYLSQRQVSLTASTSSTTGTTATPLNDSSQRAHLSFLMQERQLSSSLRRRRSSSGYRHENSLSAAARYRQGDSILEELAGIDSEEWEARRRRMEHLQRRLNFLYRLVILVIRLCHQHMLTSRRLGQTFRSQQEVIDLCRSNENGGNGVLSFGGGRYTVFNKAEFRANRQMRLSTEARRVLAKRPEDRADDEVNYAVIALRGIHQLADYPVRMQRNLARMGVLESFETGRVVVRQNDPAHAFYIITYGVVLVCVLDQSADTAHTVVELSKGDSFGELAIVNRGKRQSTVICKTDCDLLAIDIPAYEAIFMQGGQKKVTDPDHEEFIRSLDFLRGWPVQHLQQQHPKFMFCYFKRSVVMVKNSGTSRWIYIIKSGSAQVLFALEKTEPQVANAMGELVLKQQHQVADGTAPYMWQFYDSSGLLRPARSAADRWQQDQLEKRKTRPLTVATVARADGRCRGSAGTSYSAKLRHQQSRPLSVETKSQAMAEFLSKDGSDVNPQSTNRTGIRMGRKTFYDELDDGNVELPSEKLQFVRLGTLTRGGVFGLQHLFPQCSDRQQQQPSLCVVSNGAECLLLDRRYFLENAPRRLLDRLRNQIDQFPSREQLQNRLQSVMDWEAYKRLLVDSLMQEKQQIRPNTAAESRRT